MGKLYYTYASAMAELDISRRTLRRWLDDLKIESLEFDGCRKAFLTCIHVAELTWYSRVMHTRDFAVIGRYRRALEHDDQETIESIRANLK